MVYSPLILMVDAVPFFLLKKFLMRDDLITDIVTLPQTFLVGESR